MRYQTTPNSSQEAKYDPVINTVYLLIMKLKYTKEIEENPAPRKSDGGYE